MQKYYFNTTFKFVISVIFLDEKNPVHGDIHTLDEIEVESVVTI